MRLRPTEVVLAVALLAVVAAAWPACRPAASPSAPPLEPVSVESRDLEPDTIELEPAQILRAGIELAPAEPETGREVIDGYGSILDPTPLADAVLARAAAGVAFEAARRELVRVQALNRANENASARDRESAEALAHRTALEAEAAEARLGAVAGVGLAERSDLAELVRRLVAGSASLARIDVVAAVRVTPPAQLEISEALQPGVAYAGQLLGAAPAVDAALQGRGFYYSIDEPALPFGTALAARLPSAASPGASVRVPPQAVVWKGGHPFVFVALGAGRFQARSVEIRELSPTQWLATRGLASGDTIVVAGAPLLLTPPIVTAGVPD